MYSWLQVFYPSHLILSLSHTRTQSNSFLSRIVMDSLTLSSPLNHHSLLAVRRPSLLQNPTLTTLSLQTQKTLTSSLKCSLTSFHQQTPTSSSSQESLLLHLSASAPQAPAAPRGLETDAMGLLLRERIVFLGSQIDDFVADAIISQLLLLDAQDPNKDIRLFVNSPGGSLRCVYAIFDWSKVIGVLFFNNVFSFWSADFVYINSYWFEYD